MKKKKWALCNYCGRIYKLGKKCASYNSCKYCAPICWLKATLLKSQDLEIYKEEGVKDMHDIKLVIDGNEIQLTEEQLIKSRMNVLGLLPKSENPFTRVKANKSYYTLSGDTYVRAKREDNTIEDDKRYDACNYFNDKYFANQIALHQLLYRKLLKFAYDNYDNECKDTATWNGENCHWSIDYVCTTKDFIVSPHYDCKSQDVYFSSDEVASRAIKEVVEPFIKEHPELVW